MNPPAEAGRWLTRSERSVLLVTLLYMAGWLVLALVRGNQEFLFYLLVMGVLLVAACAVHGQARLPLGALWGLSLWGLAHMAGGLMPIPASWPAAGRMPVLYNLWLIPGWLKYDHVVHAYGFGLMTWICWEVLAGAFARRGARVEPTWGLLTLCAAAGMGFGAANEVVEFAATLLVPGTNVGGYANTGWDLVANTVGALAAALLVRRLRVPPGKT